MCFVVFVCFVVKQGFLLRTAQSFQLTFPPERVADRSERFPIDQADWPAPGGVPRTAPAVVHLLACLGIARVPGVQRAIRAADDIHKVHGEIVVRESAPDRPLDPIFRRVISLSGPSDPWNRMNPR